MLYISYFCFDLLEVSVLLAAVVLIGCSADRLDERLLEISPSSGPGGIPGMLADVGEDCGIVDREDVEIFKSSSSTAPLATAHTPLQIGVSSAVPGERAGC